MKRKSYLLVTAALVILTGYLGRDQLLSVGVAFGYGGGGGGGGGGYTNVTDTYVSTGTSANQGIRPYMPVVVRSSTANGAAVTVNIPQNAFIDLYSVRISQVTEADAYNQAAYSISFIDDNTGRALTSLARAATVRIANLNLPPNLTGVSLQSYQGGAWSSYAGAAFDAAADSVVFTTSAPVKVAVFSNLPPTPPNPGSTGHYDPKTVREATTTIDTDKGLVVRTTPTACPAGKLVRSSQNPAVYYCGRDGRRHVFVNEAVFRSWFSDFSGLVILTPADLASIPLGDNITYRPGVRMIKIQSDPRVYAISRGGLLRWIPTEAAARALYGADWSHGIDDVSDAFFVNYRIGNPITDADL